MKEYNFRLIVRSTVYIAIIVLLILALSGSVFQVDSGQKAVVLRFGAINRESTEGLNFKLPFVEKVVLFEMRILKSETNTIAYSRDLQTTDLKIALNYRITDDVTFIYKNLGTNYAERVIDPAIQESVKQVVAKYNSTALIDQREQVKDEIKLSLSERLRESGIKVYEFSVLNFDFSDTYEEAIEAKQKAQQDALKSENELLTYKFQAEQKIATARGNSESAKLNADGEAYSVRVKADAEAYALLIIGQELAKQSSLIQYKAIEKWDGAVPKINGVSPVPFMETSLTTVDEIK